MAYQILRQPDGKFAVFSSFTGTFVLWDATPPEVIDHFVAWEAERTRKSIELLLDLIQNGEQAYHGMGLTWTEALDDDRVHGGTVWRMFPSERKPDDKPLGDQ